MAVATAHPTSLESLPPLRIPDWTGSTMSTPLSPIRSSAHSPGPTPGRSSTSSGPNFLFPSSAPSSASTCPFPVNHSDTHPHLHNFSRSRSAKPSSSAGPRPPTDDEPRPLWPPISSSPPITSTQAQPARPSAQPSPTQTRSSKSLLHRLPTLSFFGRKPTNRSRATPVDLPIQVWTSPPSSPPNKRSSRIFSLRSPTSPTSPSKSPYVSRPQHRLLAQSLMSATPLGGGLGLGGEGLAPAGAARMEGWRRSVAVAPEDVTLNGWMVEEEMVEEERVEVMQVGGARLDRTSPVMGAEHADQNGSSKEVHALQGHRREYSLSVPNLHEQAMPAATRQPVHSLNRPATNPTLPVRPVVSDICIAHDTLDQLPVSPSHPAPAQPRPRTSPSSSARSRLHRLTTFLEPSPKRRHDSPARGRTKEKSVGEGRREGLGDRLVVHSPETISRMVREFGEEGMDEGDRKRMESFYL